MYLMCIAQLDRDKVVHMGWEALKAGFVAHEAMYID